MRRYRELENNLGLSKDVPRIESALKVWVEIYAALDVDPAGGARLVPRCTSSMRSRSDRRRSTIEVDNESTSSTVVERARSGRTSTCAGRAKNPPDVVGRAAASARSRRRATRRHVEIAVRGSRE